MCLILFAVQRSVEQPLVVAANRDEFYARPTEAARFWGPSPRLLAGRDQQGGGTWLGVDASGRFAAVTNVRSAEPRPAGLRSRGALPRDFLAGCTGPEGYLRQVAARAEEYAGFNLLVGDSETLWYFSNRGEGPRQLEPGVYGVSNATLNVAWPKVLRGKARLDEHLQRGGSMPSLLKLLRDGAPEGPPGVGRAPNLDRIESCGFLVSADYGTRASTVVSFGRNGRVEFVEQGYGAWGVPGGTRRFVVTFRRSGVQHDRPDAD